MIRNNIINDKGLTLVEIIISIAVLGIVICPLMSMFLFAMKINNKSDFEYKTLSQAQYYMEEIKAMEYIDTIKYPYNNIKGIYEREIEQDDETFGVIIKITPDSNGLLYKIEILIMDEGEIVNYLEGTKIIY
ncbi:prepilin-type N-terminal cleavage/methylation domain-containing protein [Sedimentibacter sp. MB31-C6]|uniref:prepilin-type N-terminal cleavage/methylation domain-containing protein n=1 Tax=Sedimentibacter sp. MB31-C6 TaxID=3109366 RepID=UPI002DDCB486|nr:prepilin-type N-terminal cleavage/methylation domain-containing protein [Sedimentibacter sp. MB36-C1]WSI03809.1 prepilin-type N-terminal cleavage/methylation domain-containing protein [Sedimentibacter sp. MB36-C1]